MELPDQIICKEKLIMKSAEDSTTATLWLKSLDNLLQHHHNLRFIIWQDFHIQLWRRFQKSWISKVYTSYVRGSPSGSSYGMETNKDSNKHKINISIFCFLLSFALLFPNRRDYPLFEFFSKISAHTLCTQRLAVSLPSLPHAQCSTIQKCRKLRCSFNINAVVCIKRPSRTSLRRADDAI